MASPAGTVANKAGISPAPSSPAPFGVFLGPVGYVLVKIGLLAFHAVCAAYFVAAGLAYHVLPDTSLARMLSFYTLTLQKKYFERIAVVHFVVAALHVYVMASALVSLATRRALARRLRRQTTSIRRRVTRLLASPVARDVVDSAPPAWPRFAALVRFVRTTRLGRLVSYVYAVLLAPQGFFGVESRHFETLFLVREVSETVLQAFQAYQMSRLLPREQLNRFYVAILVLNCWSTPLLHRLFRGRNQALSRLLCLLFDIGLDFVSVVGVPVWLTLDYMPSYDAELTDFPDALWYDDTWLVRLMNDAPLILLSSWLEAFSRLVFSLSMLATLEDVKNLIKRKPGATRAAVTHPTEAAAAPYLSAGALQTVLVAVSTSTRTRIERGAHRLLAVFGVAILCIQIHAESKASPTSCVLQVRPWLISRPACALIEIDCWRDADAHAGDRSYYDAVFDHLDTVSLEHIVMRHCPRVAITPQLQSFHRLVGFKTYNVTLTTWDADAAIMQTHHPQLRFLYFVRTNFPNATLPVGLLSSEFPPSLRDIEICGTNLNRLPDTLHERWPTQLTFFIEYGELTEYPMVLAKMSVRMLSLCNNQIAVLPAEALAQPDTYLVAFTGNPIAALPELPDGALVSATHVFVDTTQITGPLPKWVDEAFTEHTALFLGSSPFCVDVVLNEESTERTQLLETRPWLVDGRVDCSVIEEQSFYPYGIDVRDGEEAAE